MRSFMHNGRRYTEVSLGSVADEEPDARSDSLGRLIRSRPLSHSERGNVVRTRSGNLVQAVAR